MKRVWTFCALLLVGSWSGARAAEAPSTAAAEWGFLQAVDGQLHFVQVRPGGGGQPAEPGEPIHPSDPVLFGTACTGGSCVPPGGGSVSCPSTGPLRCKTSEICTCKCSQAPNGSWQGENACV